MAASSLVSNLSRTFSSSSGFSRTYSTGPKPFHFTKLHQANMSPLPAPATAPKSRRSGTSGPCAAVCCCCLTGCVSMLVTAVIGVGLFTLILWLVLRPIHTPSYSLQSVTFTHLLYTPSSRTFTAAFDYTLTAENPNRKIGVQYDYINSETTYMGHVLAPRTRIAGFYHGHRNVTRIPVKFSTIGFPLPPVEGAALQGEIAAGSNVTLVVHVDVRAHLEVGALRTPSYTVHVNCDVSVHPPVGAGALAAVVCRKR